MYTKTREEALKKFNLKENYGLDNAAVNASRIKYGKNVITPSKKKSLFRRILDALCDPMLIILVFAWAVTFGVNLGRKISGGEASFYECIGILIAIGISVTLTVVMEGRSKKAFEVLSSLTKHSAVKVLRAGEIVYLPQSEIVVGDIILVESGDKISADGRVISANGLRIDESTLTGESKNVEKFADVRLGQEIPLAERINMVYSGTFVAEGSGRFIVTAVGDKAEIGKLADDLKTNTSLSAPLKEKLSRLGKMVSIFGLVSAAFVFFLSLARLIVAGQADFQNIQNLFIEAIILIVAAVPEGLPSTMAISLTLNVLQLAKSNALIRKLVAAETAGCVSVICSDKTGTLTENKMTVERLVCGKNQKFVEINAAVNSTAELGKKGEHRGSETEAALLTYLMQERKDYLKIRKSTQIFSRVPFSSDLKYMTTEIEFSGKKVTLVKGAPEKLVEMCGFNQSQKNRLFEELDRERSRARRIIAFAHIIDDKASFDGYAVLCDKLRNGVRESVQNCLMAGINVKILTGDNSVTAVAIADELGIGKGYGKVINGDVIEKMSDEELLQQISGISVVARSTPKVKLRVVKALQAIGEVVAVTGDGVNDAPAVKHADIGIAMGGGSEITKEASDIILLDDSFSTIIRAIYFGRSVFGNFQRFIMFQLTVNLSSMCIIIAYLLMGLASPFTSTGLLWLNIIMDGPLALSLGLEKCNENYAGQKPVKRSDNILSARILLRVALNSAFVGFVVAFQEMFNFLCASVLEKSTVTFVLFVMFQLFNSLNCRFPRADSMFKNFFGNKLLLITCVFTFVLQIIITQYVPAFFATVPLSLVMWLKIIALASLIVVFSESYKLLYRLTQSKKTKTSGLGIKKLKTV